MDYPIRINKYLALKNICSRREADALIQGGKVKINGQNAKLGDMIHHDDKVVVLSKKKVVYYAFNKPKGIVTHSPQKNEIGIEGIVKFSEKIFPIGRLDKDSRGLIILTNDGRITDKLLSPEYDHEKEYDVQVNKVINQSFLDKMSRGVVLDDGYKTKNCLIRKNGKNSFSIILTEGKKRQIRRMCESLGYKVVDLNRVRIMNIFLNNLEAGKHRLISGGELQVFKRTLGL